MQQITLSPRERRIVAAAGFLGFVSVAAGAFAAHGLHDPKAQEWLRTGALYGFVHVLASLVAVLLERAGAARTGRCALTFLPGVLIFSGSLYAMALGGPLWLGAITPIGGLLFLIGWAILAWSALRPKPQG